MKKLFFTIIILILVLCSPVLLIACSEPINKDYATNQLSENSIQSGNNKVDSATISFDNNQIIATLVGGVCSIFGGVLGGVVTVLISNKSEKKKLQISYYKSYYSFIHKFKEKIDDDFKKGDFNFQDCESIIEEFKSDFEESSILSFYIEQLYYCKGIKKLKDSLDALLLVAERENYSSKKMYEELNKIFESEKEKIKKRLH